MNDESTKKSTYLDQDIHFYWDLEDGRIAHCREIICQPYTNFKVSGGLVTGIEPDTIYFMVGRNDQTPTIFFLRPDEAQAFAWVLTGTLWSHMLPGDPPGENPFK